MTERPRKRKMKKDEKWAAREINKIAAEEEKKSKRNQNPFHSIRSMMGNTWAAIFVLLGAREAGKSYSVMEYFLNSWKRDGIPFYWLRLNEASMNKLLKNKAEKLVDADLARRFKLDLTVRGNNVYDGGKKMATVLALSTFANDKGVGYYDKDFLKNPKMEYHIALDEFELEKTQRSQGDIAYQFIQQIENLIRSTKERLKIFLIGNTLEEASDILAMIGFIPERFGRYKLKSKRTIIDYIPPSEAYKARRRGTIQEILAGGHSNFTNEIDTDRSLVTKERLIKPTAVVVFARDARFTIWDDKVVAPYNGEKTQTVIAMRPYLDLVFQQQLRDHIIGLFDLRAFLFRNLITFKRFQKEIALIKPRKGG